MSLVAAHLLPLLFGALAYALLIERPRSPDAWLRVLGYGYLVGLAAIVVVIVLLRPSPVAVFATVATVLVVISVLAGAYATRAQMPEPAGGFSPPAIEPSWTRWLALALLVWLCWRGFSLGTEVAIRPLFPWDAWATWSVKAKAWYLADTWREFVGFQAWLADPQARYLAAWHYPNAIPLLEVWFASAVGAWHAPAILSLWPALWLAGIAVLLGQLRACGTAWWLALIATFCWASLPLVQTHVALAGYADLPMTVLFGACVLALARWLAGHGRQHLVLAAAFVLMLPALKLEGALWLLVVAAGVVHRWLPERWRGLRLALVLALLALWAALFGLALPLPGVGWVEIGWGYLHLPHQEANLVLAWRAVGAQFVEGLLLAPNWHLLWWLTPIVLLATVPVWRSWATLGWILGLGFGAIMFIFFVTDAAQWADNLTAVNRVLMHLTLAWVGWLALLTAQAMQRRERLSGIPGAALAAEAGA